MARLPEKHGRVVSKNDYQEEYERLRARAQTEEYLKVRKEHPKVERKLAEMVNWHGARRARYRGRWRVKIQLLMTAIVVNIKRIVRLLTGSLGAVLEPGVGA
jgi:IS5 family transposase